MHELFTKVLSKRDLSKAGELFSVSDSEIVHDLNDVLTEIDHIISQSDYLQSSNNQSVVEICITRILSCIRETKTIENYCPALVILLDTCLHYNLKSKGPNQNDPPHAKIAADIFAVFLNYDKKEVMKICVPIAIKYLPKGNRELTKNLASYLSLAAIENAYLLSDHVDQIMDSIFAGNYGLCRVLFQIYEIKTEKISINAPLLVGLLPRCDTLEKLALLQLFALIAQKKPTVLESSVNQFCELLTCDDNQIIIAIMTVLDKIAKFRPNLIVDFDIIKKSATKKNPLTITLAAQILGTSGKVNKDKAAIALDFILEHLPYVDRTSQSILLQEATKLCSTYPVLFSDKVLQCVRQKNLNASQQLSSSGPVETTNINGGINKTSGGITIVKLNSPSSQMLSNATTNTPINTATISVTVTSASSTVTTTLPKQQQQQHLNNAIKSLEKTIEETPSLPLSLASPVTSSNHIKSNAVHAGYTRRVKLGDSRSTGRLHPSTTNNTHRSMTRLHGGSVGGLKSIDRLSSNGSNCDMQHQHQQHPTTTNSSYSNTSNNVIITGHNNKWNGMPSASTKIISGGVTVTTRPLSQGKIILLDTLNQSTGSITTQQISMASNSNLLQQKSVMTFPASSNNTAEAIVSVSGPTTNITPRRNDNKSVTLLNANNSIVNQRMSTFEPYQIMRDPVQQFCEKHFQSIRKYMDESSKYLPPPCKCTLEERRTKKVAKLHFACQIRGPHCLYSKTCFTMRTRNPKTWIHLMFLDFQVRNYIKEKCVLSTREPGISNLKNLWQILKSENSFTELVTSHFPSTKDREILVNELRHSGFLDVFEVIKTDKTKPNANNELEFQWSCFLCNHPDRAVILRGNNNQPMIEGRLKEKKGKWRLFKRWRTRYFTLSGAHLSCKGASGGESIDVNQIRSVKVSRGSRNIPKCFEIFTGDQTLILKPKDGKNAEEWVQCLSIAVAHYNQAKTNSLPVHSRTAL